MPLLPTPVLIYSGPFCANKYEKLIFNPLRGLKINEKYNSFELFIKYWPKLYKFD